MRRSFSSSITAITSLVVLLNTTQAAEKLYVQTPAGLDKGASIDPKVKEECAIENRVAYFVKEKTLGNFDIVPSKTLTDAGNNKVLSLNIVNVEGTGGGVWSGSKGITVQGTLKENDKVLGTFLAKRNSGGGGYWSQKKFSSTCSLFENSAKEIGEDISSWLKQPSMDAKLGDMK